MSFDHISNRAYRALLLVVCIAAVFVAVNPFAEWDIVVITAAVFAAGHIFLQEKLLLAFLIARPLIDVWRDYVLFRYQGFEINLNAVFAIVFLLWSLGMLLRYRKRLKTLPLNILFPVLAAYMLGSSFWSINPAQSIIESIKFINIAAFLYLGFLFYKARKINLHDMVAATIVAAVVPVLSGAYQLVTGSGIATFDLRGRIFGTFAHPNLFAFFLVFLIFLLIHFSTIDVRKFWKKRERVKNGLLFLLLLLLAATFTRAAWIGLLVFLAVIGVLKYRKMIAYVFGALALLYFFIFPLNQVFRGMTQYNLESMPLVSRLTARNEDADSFAWRLSVFRETQPLIAAKRWFGYGYGTFEQVWTENRSLAHQFDDSAEAHNDYLRLALEIGFAGLLLYAAILFRLLQLSFRPIKKTLKGREEYIYLFAWVLTFVIAGLSDNMLNHKPVMWFMWAWWGVLLAYYKKYETPNFIVGRK